jgi:hypothetical protein
VVERLTGEGELRLWLDDDLENRRASDCLGTRHYRLAGDRAIHTANPVARDQMTRAIERYAGESLRVRRTMTDGGKRQFCFEAPGVSATRAVRGRRQRHPEGRCGR